MTPESTRKDLIALRASKRADRDRLDHEIEALDVVLALLPENATEPQRQQLRPEGAVAQAVIPGGTDRVITTHPPINDIIVEVLADEGAILRNTAIKQRAATKYPNLPRPQTVQEQVSRLAKEGRLTSEIFGKARYFALPEWREGAEEGLPFALKYIPKRLHHHLDVNRALGVHSLLGDTDTQNNPVLLREDGATETVHVNGAASPVPS